MVPNPHDRWSVLRRRWPALLLVTALLLVLQPHPTPDPLRDPLRAAAQHLQAGRDEAALGALESAFDFAPNLASARWTAAELALDRDMPERALHHLSWLPAGFDRDTVCLEASARLRLAEPGATVGLIEETPARCPLPLPTLADLVQRAFASDQPELARSLSAEWARLAPESAPAALESAVATALLDPANAAAPAQRALELDTAEDELAAALLRAAEAARAGEPRAYALAQAGQALARAGRWQQARHALQAALELEPDYTEARAYLGLALDRSGGDGLQVLEQAYRESNRAALPASFLGLHWLEIGALERALDYLERAAGLQPENPAYQAQLASAHEALGDLQTARSHYEQAAALAADQASFHALLAEFSLRHEIDMDGLGLPAAQRAYRLEPSPRHADLLGYAHLLAGHLTAAERLLQHAAAEAPDMASVRYHLALLRLEQGQPAAAHALLEQVVALEPDGRYAELAARTLERIGR